jgi:arylformamidase
VIIHDISPILSSRVAVWPGDTPFRRTVNASIAGGANIDLSDVHTTVHVGAHTDAPSHYVAAGQTIEQRPLERYYGLCQVIDVDVQRGERIRPEHIDGPIDAPRVLFRTGTFPDSDAFNEDFAALSPELIDHLAKQGVSLVGLDTPSVDLFADAALLSHQAIARHDMAVVEGVVLDAVKPGVYTLIALPLRLEGADASPVRAVLVEGA